jgi:hypothetical protein
MNNVLRHKISNVKVEIVVFPADTKYTVVLNANFVKSTGVPHGSVCPSMTFLICAAAPVAWAALNTTALARYLNLLVKVEG